jgi:small subunit ribosomal protein S17
MPDAETDQAAIAEPGKARGKRKVLEGRVVSDKMDKTVVVEITHRLLHPTYRKFVTRRKKYKAHDETNRCGHGDLVRIIESRPLSKEKRWRVQDVLEKAVGV